MFNKIKSMFEKHTPVPVATTEEEYIATMEKFIILKNFPVAMIEDMASWAESNLAGYWHIDFVNDNLVKTKNEDVVVKTELIEDLVLVKLVWQDR